MGQIQCAFLSNKFMICIFFAFILFVFFFRLCLFSAKENERYYEGMQIIKKERKNMKESGKWNYSVEMKNKWNERKDLN